MFRRKHVCLFIFAAFLLACRFFPRSSSLTPLRATVPHTKNITGTTNLGETTYLRGRHPFIGNSSQGKRSSPLLQHSPSQQVRTTNGASATVDGEGNGGNQDVWGKEIDGIEAEFQRRKNHITKMCGQLYIEPASIIYLGDVDESRCQAIKRRHGYKECIFSNNFPLARSASSMTCLINKVASTSIVSSMLSADGSFRPPANIGESPHMYVPYIVAKREIEFEFAQKYFFKFVVVRHPFRRLLSAFRDKVENAPHWSLFELRQDIYDHKHKLNSFSSNLAKENEVEMKENDIRRSETMLFNETIATIDASNFVPSFEEFLYYILDSDLQGQGYEAHWVPYWRRCAPCSIQYDVIAKLEMAPFEMRYIWNRMMVGDIPWQNKSDETKRKEEEMLRRYYSQLSVDVIMEVYRNYFLDFVLFNYDIRDVLQLGNHCGAGDDCNELLTQYGYNR